jgi:hypothetical protein
MVLISYLRYAPKKIGRTSQQETSIPPSLITNRHPSPPPCGHPVGPSLCYVDCERYQEYLEEEVWFLCFSVVLAFDCLDLQNSKDVALNAPIVERKVKDATSNEKWGPTGTQMQEISRASYNLYVLQ